jgi:hypothetical protein
MYIGKSVFKVGTNIFYSKNEACCTVGHLVAGGVVALLLSMEQLELNRRLKVALLPHLLARPMQLLCMALWHWLHL